MEQINYSFFILTFSSLFTLLNPIGITPILLSLTENMSDSEYISIVKKGIFTAFFILILFSFMGDLIFKFYGITINAFMIAGGIIFFRNSLDMIEAKVSRASSTPQEEEEAENKNDIGITPIGIPTWIVCITRKINSKAICSDHLICLKIEAAAIEVQQVRLQLPQQHRHG